jgi:hypothetical protein
MMACAPGRHRAEAAGRLAPTLLSLGQTEVLGLAEIGSAALRTHSAPCLHQHRRPRLTALAAQRLMPNDVGFGRLSAFFNIAAHDARAQLDQQPAEPHPGDRLPPAGDHDVQRHVPYSAGQMYSGVQPSMSDRPPLRRKHKLIFAAGSAVILIALIIFVGMTTQYVIDASK